MGLEGGPRGERGVLSVVLGGGRGFLPSCPREEGRVVRLVLEGCDLITFNGVRQSRPLIFVFSKPAKSDGTGPLISNLKTTLEPVSTAVLCTVGLSCERSWWKWEGLGSSSGWIGGVL